MTGAPTVAVVADDCAVTRETLAALLREKLGFVAVVDVSSMAAALDAFEGSAPIALAVFDLDLPGLADASRLRRMRERFPQTKTVVVALSDRREDMLAALAAGAHGYVIKSTPVEAMGEALADVLAGRIVVPPRIADFPTHVAEPAFRLALTDRQQDVLRLLLEKRSNKEIARALALGVGTVKIHLAGVYRALGVRGRREAARAATRGLLTDDAQSSAPAKERKKGAVAD